MTDLGFRDEISSHFHDKKVLILGLGLNQGGVGSAKFFAKKGAKVRVSDLKNEQALKPSLNELEEFSQIEYVLGQHRNEDIDWAELIIKNQALKNDNPFLEYARQKGKEIETDMGVFLNYVNSSQLIGVTGTKGKTTTASLVYSAVKEDPRFRGDDGGVALAGNIGKSVLEALDIITPKSLVILELSSFQLEAFESKKVSPKFAVITNILSDHLNYYSSMDEYVLAKKIITKYQTKNDYLFLRKDDPIAQSDEFLSAVVANIINFSVSDLPDSFEPFLKGEHNLLNYAAALAVCKRIDIPEEEALQAMNNFEGAQFRLQFKGSIDGVKIYNDSASTMPDSTIEALKVFNNAILIVGGMDKNLDYGGLAKQIDKSAKAVYFLEGNATDKLRDLLQHRNIIRSIYSDLDNLFKDLKTEIRSGDIILFSPGATSFNLFQNEFDRGRKFNEAMERAFNINEELRMKS